MKSTNRRENLGGGTAPPHVKQVPHAFALCVASACRSPPLDKEDCRQPAVRRTVTEWSPMVKDRLKKVSQIRTSVTTWATGLRKRPSPPPQSLANAATEKLSARARVER